MTTAHDLPDIPCPGCGAHELRIEIRLKVVPLAALAGRQPKMSAASRPWLVCGACDVEAAGTPVAT